MILARCGDGFTEGLEMLEASRMERTDVTQGDIEGFLTPDDGSAHTPASVESASRTLTGFDYSAYFNASWFSFQTSPICIFFRDCWFGGRVGEDEGG